MVVRHLRIVVNGHVGGGHAHSLHAGSLQYAGAYNSLYLIRNKKNPAPGTAMAKSPLRGDLGGLRVKPVIINDDIALYEIKADRFPIGAFLKDKTNKFTNHQFDLYKGDTIYIFSDGYPDQFGGPKGKKFRYKQFKELLVSIHNSSIEDQKQILDQTFEQWRGKEEQVDDVLVMGIRF